MFNLRIFHFHFAKCIAAVSSSSCKWSMFHFSVFFSKKSWHNIVDFVVVILSFAATIAAFVVIADVPIEDREEVDGHMCEKKDDDTVKGFSLLVVIRIVRIFRFLRLLRLYFEHRSEEL